MSEQTQPTAAPTRSERKACWEHRDVYYACLTKNNIVAPPGTDMSSIPGIRGKIVSENMELSQDPCAEERKGYESNCIKSWIDYFNKRRVLEENQRKLYAQTEADRTSRK